MLNDNYPASKTNWNGSECNLICTWVAQSVWSTILSKHNVKLGGFKARTRENQTFLVFNKRIQASVYSQALKVFPRCCGMCVCVCVCVCRHVCVLHWNEAVSIGVWLTLLPGHCVRERGKNDPPKHTHRRHTYALLSPIHTHTPPHTHTRTHTRTHTHTQGWGIQLLAQHTQTSLPLTSALVVGLADGPDSSSVCNTVYFTTLVSSAFLLTFPHFQCQSWGPRRLHLCLHYEPQISTSTKRQTVWLYQSIFIVYQLIVTNRHLVSYSHLPMPDWIAHSNDNGRGIPEIKNSRLST